MLQYQIPGKLKGNDFMQPGWYSEPTAAYQMMFEFLRLSPSYHLAHLYRTSKLSSLQTKKLPKDFAQVLATYDLIGDVGHVLFRDWWLAKGIKVFGKPYSKPGIHKIAVFANGQQTDLKLIGNGITNVLQEARKAEGLSAALIVSIPLTLKRNELLKKFGVLIDEYLDMNVYEEIKPKIKLKGERFHIQAMAKGLRLIWLKADNPDLELWRLGAKANLSASYSKILDPCAPRKTKNPTEVDDRNIMGKITFRSLSKFERVAENAARGIFPSEDSVDCLKFEYHKLDKRLQSYYKWIVKKRGEKSKKIHLEKTQFLAEALKSLPIQDRDLP
jgi:hypothetical protein